jgi:hypothetical protein
MQRNFPILVTQGLEILCLNPLNDEVDLKNLNFYFVRE